MMGTVNNTGVICRFAIMSAKYLGEVEACVFLILSFFGWLAIMAFPEIPCDAHVTACND